MSRREIILASVVGGLVGVLALGFGVRAFIVAPLKELDKRIASARDRVNRLKAERRACFEAEDRMKAHSLHVFADTVDQASAKSGEMLTRLILKSGLPEEEFSRLPVGPRRLRGAEEIGWSVQGDGPLADVIDLLFTLQESPYFHRIENLSLNQGDSPGLVRVRFRFLTLVMDPAHEVERKELVPKYALDSAQRHLFDGVVTRDLLRPYIKRPPPPAPPPASSPGGSPSKAPPPPGPETFRIVSLSEWMGQPEIHVRDLTAQRTVRYKVGDALAGGIVACVDYRSLPMPGNEFLRSDSRVIVRVGTEYWAIERGGTLADKRKLAPEQLPAELAKAK